MVIGLVLEMTPDSKNKYKPNKRMQPDASKAGAADAERYAVGKHTGIL